MNSIDKAFLDAKRVTELEADNARLRAVLRDIDANYDLHPKAQAAIDAALAGATDQPRTLTSDERRILNAALDASITVLHEGVDATDQPSVCRECSGTGIVRDTETNMGGPCLHCTPDPTDGAT